MDAEFPEEQRESTADQEERQGDPAVAGRNDEGRTPMMQADAANLLIHVTFPRSSLRLGRKSFSWRHECVSSNHSPRRRCSRSF